MENQEERNKIREMIINLSSGNHEAARQPIADVLNSKSARITASLDIHEGHGWEEDEGKGNGDTDEDYVCNCGSGLEPEAHYDARGIYLTSACERCVERKLGGFRREVLDDPDYDADEDIDEEYDDWDRSDQDDEY